MHRPFDLRSWLNAALDKAAPHPDAPFTPRYVFVARKHIDKQHAITLAEKGATKHLRKFYPELAKVFDRVRKPRGGNRIKGLKPSLKYGRLLALETALQEREVTLALLKQRTGKQRGHVALVEELVAERNDLTLEEVHRQRIHSRIKRPTN